MRDRYRGCGLHSCARVSKKHKQTLIKLAALALAVCFVVISLAASVYIILYENHDHAHDFHGVDTICKICVFIFDSFKQTGTAIRLAQAVLPALFSAILALCHSNCFLVFKTPVYSKVRINA